MYGQTQLFRCSFFIWLHSHAPATRTQACWCCYGDVVTKMQLFTSQMWLSFASSTGPAPVSTRFFQEKLAGLLPSLHDMPRSDSGGNWQFCTCETVEKLRSFRATPAFGLGCKLLQHPQQAGTTFHLPLWTWWPPALLRVLLPLAFTLISIQDAIRPECNMDMVQQHHAYAKLFFLYLMVFQLFTQDNKTKLTKEISCCAIL